MTTLGERAGALLVKLEALCADGGYHIFEDADFLPEQDAGEMLLFLADSRYVDMRYNENGTYCLRLLPAGRAYAAQMREGRRAETLRLRRGALFAFLGGLAGGLAGALLMLLVLLVGG